MAELTPYFPKPHEGWGYWHLHIPVNVPKRQMLQADCVHGLLDATSRLRELRPPPSTARLVVAINLPLTSQSQIIAFFSNDYFTTFFDRKSATQTWIPLEESRSIVREWSLELPPGFSERGFQEHFFEDDYEEHGEMWFLGEL